MEEQEQEGIFKIETVKGGLKKKKRFLTCMENGAGEVEEEEVGQRK